MKNTRKNLANKKKLDIIPYCEDCKFEVVETEEGLLCPVCGAYISDRELEEYD